MNRWMIAVNIGRKHFRKYNGWLELKKVEYVEPASIPTRGREHHDELVGIDDGDS